MSKRWLPLAAALAVAIPSRIPQCEEAKQAPANEQSSTPHEQPAFAPVQAPAVSPGAHPSPAANTRNDRQQQEHWINKAWRHWARRFFSDLKITDALIAIFTGLLALFTARLWIATVRLWETSQKQTDHLVISVATVERAYISIRTFNRIVVKDGPKVLGWIVGPEWQNTGKTPTVDMLGHINFSFEDNDMPDDFGFPDLWNANQRQVFDRSFLGPNASIVGGTLNFSVDQLQDIRFGRKKLFIWGWEDYSDVFPDTDRHRTEFAVQVFVPGDPTIENERHITFNLTASP